MLALIASATDRELAKYVEFLKAENQILRARIPGQIHTTANERQKLIKLGKGIGRAPDEMYFGNGNDVAEKLEVKRQTVLL